MLSANELNGVLGMMPAFATPDAVDIKATQTIAVDNLKGGRRQDHQRRVTKHRYHGNLRRVLQFAFRRI